MLIVLAHCGNGYSGCDSDEVFFYDDDTAENEINSEVWNWACENAESFSYVHFGWEESYTDEDYDDYIEDTIFCNDRSIRNLNGWNPDGGSTSSCLQFKEYNSTSDLSCTNTTDKFSVANTLAQLTYKVGLATSPEMNLLNNIFVNGSENQLSES